MLRPVFALNAGILDRISCMNHHSIANVYTNVRNRARRIVRPSEENQVARFGFGFRNDRAAVIDAGRGGALDGHRARLVEHPAHKTGAVK